MQHHMSFRALAALCFSGCFPKSIKAMAEDSLYTRALTLTDNATAAAIIYGYPILPYLQLVYPLLNSTGPNVLTEYPLATAQTAAIVRPNVDTLYSAAPIDLSQSDVEITVPEIPDDRFYVFPLYDLFGNNFANLGSVNNTTPGKYLLRQGTTTFGVELSSDAAPYQGYVNFPTVYGLMFPRIVIRNNNTDVAIANSYRNQIALSPVVRTGAEQLHAPPLSQALLNTTLNHATVGSLFPGGLNTSAVNELLRLTALLTPYNLPENRSQVPLITKTLAAAGIENGIYSPPPNLNVTLLELLVNGTLATALSTPALEKFGNDWDATQANVSGDYHSGYSTRAYVAWEGYLQLAPYEALYPNYHGPLAVDRNLLTLKPDQSLLFTFSGKPPVKGFWSLTVYGAENFLVPNPYAIYSLGDRSNLTYPDGTLIYGNSSNPSRNDPFQILMQPSNVLPPANWTSNWLPAPADGGIFSVNLRWYGPTEAFQNGSYTEPVVTRQAAFRADAPTSTGNASASGSSSASASASATIASSMGNEALNLCASFLLAAIVSAATIGMTLL